MGIDLQRFKGKRSKEWLDWLEDSPPSPSLREKMRSRAVERASRPVRGGSRPHAATSVPKPSSGTPDPGAKIVAIHIALPSIKAIKRRLHAVRAKLGSVIGKHRKAYITGFCAVVILAVGAGSYASLAGSGSDPVNDPDVLSQNTQKPAFEYSLPGGEETALEGEVRYDPNRKVVNFKDSIGGVTIIISQQPLPEGFSDDTTEKVRKLAEGFSATEALTTASPTAYLGTSVEGPQTVIFAKNDLLVFIRSDKAIDKRDWAQYVTNLQ